MFWSTCSLSLMVFLAYTSQARVPINHDDPEYISNYGPFSSFKTEPKIESFLIDVVEGDHRSPLAYDGFLMFTATTFNLGGFSWGPQIFDNQFNLVYMPSPDHQIAAEMPHICNFQGDEGPYLCLGAADTIVRGPGQTFKAVYNSSYISTGKEFGATGGLGFPDGHEYNMLAGGRSLLQIVYETRIKDLTEFGGPEEGHVQDACIQEVSVDTGEATFTWCFLDHLPVWETNIFLWRNDINLTNAIAGDGTEKYRWDAIHPNSADKNSEGDYLISSRHLDQVMKIAGNGNVHGVKPGTILWRLGGKSGDFELDQPLFSRQHHARFIETTRDYTTLSLFDNSWDGDNPSTSDASAGRIIRINNKTMEAEVIRNYVHPHGSLSLAQGSMQILPNQNALVGWGANPQISEFEENGSLIYHAFLTKSKDIYNYRAYKSHWVGRPFWPPKIIAYTQTCTRGPNSPLVAYVSWNGATEVHSYRFSVSLHNVQGPWARVGTFPKTGFETQVRLLESGPTKYLPFVPLVAVEALDHRGVLLGSAIAKTFVPTEWAAKQCNATECFAPPRFDYHERFDSSDQCMTSSRPTYFALFFAFAVLEVSAYIYRAVIGMIVIRSRHRTRRKRQIMHTTAVGILEKSDGFYTV